MRNALPLLALLVLPATVSAQRGVNTTPAPPAPAPTRQRPRVVVVDRYPQYVYPAVRISIDSAANIAENRYQGWQVDSKELVRAYAHQYYKLTLIVPGEVGFNEAHLDGDTGETLELTHVDPNGQRTNLLPVEERRRHRRGTGASDY